jgi:hypothetical protein
MEETTPQPSIPARICFFTTTLMLALQLSAYLDTGLKPIGLFVTGPWGESIFSAKHTAYF